MRGFDSWTVILWYRLFHLHWMYRLQESWHLLLGTVGMKPEGRRCSFKDKVLALFLLKRGSKYNTFLHSLFPVPSRWILHFALGRASMSICLIHPYALYRWCLMEIVCVVWCLVKCQSEGACISIRSVAVMRTLMTLETKAGQAMLHSFPGLHPLWSLLKVEATSSLLLDSQKH
jgi:hypothetical protein